METLFISDLHVDAVRPGKIALFEELLKVAPRRAHTLYILGDLFEAWAGDDDLREPHGRVLEALAQATGNGLVIYFMRGNRDLLVGNDFARRTGCHLLPDPAVLELDGERVLVTHGDRLCTDDRGYQAYRRLANLRLVQAGFLALPLSLRQRLVAGMRGHMHRPGRIVDVTSAAVAEDLRRHRARIIIHGHTHLEGSHELEIDGRPATRHVLGDWYGEDSLLAWNGGACRLYRVREWLDSHNQAYPRPQVN